MIPPVLGASPRNPQVPASAADVPAADVRRHEWRKRHPGSFIGRPSKDQLIYTAVVEGAEIARAYDDPDALMDLVEQAEAEGRCPLHPTCEPT